MRLSFFLWNSFCPPLRVHYRRSKGACGLLLYNITSFVAHVIYLKIKVVSAKEYGVIYLKAWAYLLNYFYKIRVISAVRVYGNEVICYFRVQGPF